MMPKSSQSLTAALSTHASTSIAGIVPLNWRRKTLSRDGVSTGTSLRPKRASFAAASTELRPRGRLSRRSPDSLSSGFRSSALSAMVVGGRAARRRSADAESSGGGWRCASRVVGE